MVAAVARGTAADGARGSLGQRSWHHQDLLLWRLRRAPRLCERHACARHSAPLVDQAVHQRHAAARAHRPRLGRYRHEAIRALRRQRGPRAAGHARPRHHLHVVDRAADRWPRTGPALRTHGAARRQVHLCVRGLLSHCQARRPHVVRAGAHPDQQQDLRARRGHALVVQAQRGGRDALPPLPPRLRHRRLADVLLRRLRRRRRPLRPRHGHHGREQKRP
mmetsp:Transcript_37088/g.89011  ORF Transcript_37088/g.89011 Transcript_37088/m.89011 type:complete len:220 (+) Transcript_37088:1571-2230(+)